MQISNKLTRVIILVSATLSFLLAIIFFFQPHMDEYVSYNLLAYLNPNYHYNQFTDGYDAHTIKFLGVLSYPRAYAYIGALSSLTYFPFYHLFPFPTSLIIYDAILYLVFIFCMQKALSLKKTEIGVLIFCFPLTFLYFHDTGPVKLSMISFPLSVILVKHIKLFSNLKSLKLWFYSFLLGLLWFLMFEDKLFYLFIYPSVLIFSCTLNDIWKPSEFMRIMPAIGIFLLMTLAYLLSPTNMAPSYLQEIQSVRINTQFGIILKNFIYSLTDFWFYTNHYLTLPFSQFIRFLIPLLIFLILWLFLTFYSHQIRIVDDRILTKRKMMGLWLSFLMMTLIFFCTGSVKNGHHYAFLWIPLIIIVLRIKIPTNIRLATKATIVTVSCLVAFSALLLPTSWFNSPDITKIHDKLEEINKEGSHIVVVASWGGYFERNINPKTNDIYIYDNNLLKFALINKLARDQKKEILMYFRKESHETIIQRISKYKYGYEQLILPDTHEWTLLKLFPVD